MGPCYSISHPCCLKIICRGHLHPFPMPLGAALNSDWKSCGGEWASENHLRQNAETQLVPDEGRYQCPGNRALSLDEITGGPRAQKLSATADQGWWPGAWTELLGLNFDHRMCP